MATNLAPFLNVFVGDSGSGGTVGLVPAPPAGAAAAGYFLSAGAIWSLPSGSGGGVTTVGALDGGTANSNAATITGTSIFLQSASASFGGIINTVSQSFVGAKTFSNLVTMSAGLTSSASISTVGLTSSDLIKASAGLVNVSLINSNTGAIALTSTSNRFQVCNPSSALSYTVNGSGLVAGEVWEIVNISANIITLFTSTFRLISQINPNSGVKFIPLVNNPSLSADWFVINTSSSQIIGQPSGSVQKAGYIGEVIQSTNTGIDMGTSGSWSDVTTVTFTSLGIWKLSCTVSIVDEGNTWTQVAMGISPNFGDTNLGLTQGLNFFYLLAPSSLLYSTGSIVVYVPQPQTNTQWNLKVFGNYTGGGTPNAHGTISAERIG